MSANALLAHFAVRGHFYEREVDGVVYQLRDRLEIYEHSKDWSEVRNGDADLVAVMMNPGGSYPLDGGLFYEDDWCDAHPDRTQYQLMRLALSSASIKHIRVLNLSDLRTPKSATLFAMLSKVGSWHSVFDEARRADLMRLLGDPSIPVLRAWGLAPQLHPLIDVALPLLQAHPTLGISDDGFAYRHPLPQRHDLQQQWLHQVTEQVRKMTFDV